MHTYHTMDLGIGLRLEFVANGMHAPGVGGGSIVTKRDYMYVHVLRQTGTGN